MMPIIKSNDYASYTVIDNKIITGPLTAPAKIILIWLLSKPKNWTVVKKFIRSEIGMGDTVFRNAFKELCDAGYIQEANGRGKDGRFQNKNFNVYDMPKLQNHTHNHEKTKKEGLCQNLEEKKPRVENPQTANHALVIKDKSKINNTTNHCFNSCELQPEKEISQFDEFNILSDISGLKLELIMREAKGLEQRMLEKIIKEYNIQSSKIKKPQGWIIKMIQRAQKGEFLPSAVASNDPTKSSVLKDKEKKLETQKLVQLSNNRANEKVLEHINSFKQVTPGCASDLMNK